MKGNPITERQEWFICSREPTICPLCKTKKVRISIVGMPIAEAAYFGKWHIAGCQPNMLIHRTWGCCKCDAAFFKDTDRNITALGALFHGNSHQKKAQTEKDKLMMKWFNECEKKQVF